MKCENSIEKLKDERGMVVVETIISFTAFVITVAGIIYFINIFTVHNKIQFAINSAAHEIASYSYFYDALGVRKASQDLNADWSGDASRIDESTEAVLKTLNFGYKTYEQGVKTYETGKETVQSAYDFTDDLGDLTLSLSLVDDVKNLYDEAEGVYNNGVQTYEEGKKTYEQGKKTVAQGKEATSKVVALLKNPKQMIAGFIGIAMLEGQSQIKHLAGSMLAEGLTEKYLEVGGMSADSYLRSYKIMGGYAGLDFSESSLFADEEQKAVDIVVEYDIDLGFLGLISTRKTAHVVQRATVIGWVGGDDNYVSKHIKKEK